MHDLKALREDPAAFDAALQRRGLGAQSGPLLEADRALRALQQRLQELQATRNDAAKRIGQAKAKKDEGGAAALMAEVAGLKDQIQAGEEEERTRSAALRDLLAAIPNLPDAEVPNGLDESGNREIRRSGSPRNLAFGPKDHVALGEDLEHMDFEAAGRVSGARFVYLKGALARLERALGAFMLDLHTGEFGYREMSPPILVRDEAMFGTAQLPKFRDDQFGTTHGYWLIPTAEVSLTNYVREQILDEAALPMRLTAHTPCFRAEAGSAGRDTRGMIRMHQFNKVELVSITTPEQSEAEHERMTSCAEEVLKRLDLPFRTMALCAGDMGFSAAKTYDIEVWLPGQNTYREISSCSNCRDFQARRMDARYRPDGQKGTRFVHTLNGSGLAVGRTLVALLETYQDEDGSIAIPDVLQPYMGGLTRIERAR
ncbi:MAG: serine--tRNA ligase [Alphaproteobacteria bacterium]|nr:serine--tRNA ligase [Alphaproteobacteria bacterium]